MKLQYNDDGTVGVPLKRKDDNGAPIWVVLEEPSLGQLAKMQVFADEADEAMPKPEALPSKDEIAKMTPEQIGEYLTKVTDVQKVLRERQMLQWSEEGPYALAFIKSVTLLSGVELTADDVFGWVANPATLRELLSWFQAPLPGLRQAEPSPAT